MSEGFKPPVAPVEASAESAYVPSAEVLAGLAASLQLSSSATEADVATAFLSSHEFSLKKHMGIPGDPVDILPTGVPEESFMEWARTAAGQ